MDKYMSTKKVVI